MAFIRTHRLLLSLAALLFAAGHAHQVLGKFHAHHHAWERHADGGGDEHDGGAHDDDHGDKQKDAAHMVSDHALIAVVPGVMVPPIVAMHAVALMKVSAVKMPEAPVAGIDHPPQLRG